MKNLPENILPPHVLSSPNGSACDQIHCTATGSRGEGELYVAKQGTSPQSVWATQSPKLQS